MMINKPGEIQKVTDFKPEQTTLMFDRVGIVAKGLFLSGTYAPKNEYPIAPKVQRGFIASTTEKVSKLARF